MDDQLSNARSECETARSSFRKHKRKLGALALSKGQQVSSPAKRTKRSNQYECSICKEGVVDQACTKCGHQFCATCLKTQARTSHSPTNHPLCAICRSNRQFVTLK